MRIWGARPTGTSDFAKTDLFLAYYVSSYVQNRFESQLLANFRVGTFQCFSHNIFESQLLVNFRVGTFPQFFTEDLLFSENMTFQKT